MEKIAIVVSKFNEFITSKLTIGANEFLQANGFTDITIITVPGAVEIPLAAKLLAEKNTFSAIICLGAVIRGDTSHYDYVCEQVSQGCQRVMLDYSVPVIFGILTTENEEQAEARAGGSAGHKGKEAAEAALAMINVVDTIRNSTTY